MTKIDINVNGQGAKVSIKDDLEQQLRKTVIKGPAALRSALLLSIEKVMAGEMSVQQANSVVGLSGEVHKSIRLQYDMVVYALSELGMKKDTNILELESNAGDGNTEEESDI